LPRAQTRRAKIRNIGYGVPSDFELNFGRYLPAFGRADDMTRTSSPTDRRLGFLNSAQAFDIATHFRSLFTPPWTNTDRAKVGL
jgi:hypothetical protein